MQLPLGRPARRALSGLMDPHPKDFTSVNHSGCTGRFEHPALIETSAGIVST